MKLLVYLEQRGGTVTDNSLALLSHAVTLGPTHAVLCGHNLTQVASNLVNTGADRILVADDPRLVETLPQPHTDAVVTATARDQYDAVLFAGSILSADIAGGLAARLEAGVNYDLIGLDIHDGELVGQRLALGDSILIEVGWRTPAAIAVFRPGAYSDVTNRPDHTTVVETVDVHFEEWSVTTTRQAHTASHSSGPSITDASVVVAGGRGLGTQDNLRLIEKLAAALDGAPAVTMPLVSAGWAPYALQIGQTGATVKPKLYIACGISGQVQHKIGMDRSEVIVAINSDASAPIFRFCDLAVVADALEVLPRLTELVSSHGRKMPPTTTRLCRS